MTSKTPNREILPDNVVPLHYDLTVEPDFKTFKFEGSVKIELKINNPAIDTVTLNTVDTDIHSAKIGDVTSSEIISEEEQQVTTFAFPKGTMSSFKGNAFLDIKFTGILNDNMAGFYRAKYEDKLTGETKYMATTQMEPTDARRAFPCFDEPNLKASFAITLVSDPSLTHLSNMDVKNEYVKDGKKVTLFNTTPKMSTYLVAFIVAELKYVESKNFRIPVRVYATPGNEKHGQFAADLTARLWHFLKKLLASNILYLKWTMLLFTNFLQELWKIGG